MNKKLLFFKCGLACTLWLLSVTGYSQQQAPDTARIMPDNTGKITEYHILYGQQSGATITQAVGQVNGTRLEKMPVANVNNALAGQLAGLRTMQTKGTPGNDAASLYLRGRTPLIIIDGIPRNYLSINPEQIETVTVLKDALATALLGVRGMDGALLITTHKGLAQPGTEITVTAQAGVQTALQKSNTLSAFDYATLYNEALQNDGRAPVYTQADLTAYKNGTDPYGHPDNNFYNALVKDAALYNRYTVNASGNGQYTKYFISLDYLDQWGMLKERATDTYNTNADYTRYIFRSNIELKLDRTLTAGLNVLGNLERSNSPGTDIDTLFKQIFSTPANAYPIYNRNGSLGGTQSYTNNVFGQSVASGYFLNNTRTGLADLFLKKDLKYVLPGLYAKVTGSYAISYDQAIDRSMNFAVFQNTSDTTYQRYNTASVKQNNSASIVSRNQQFYANAMLGYNYNDTKNTVDALLIASSDSYQNDNQLSSVYKSLGARVAYSYNQRYQLEFAGSYSGNNFFRPGHQYGFFPAGGVSWNLDKERFFAEHVKFVNGLKLRASYGKVGNANPGYYLYLQNRYVNGTQYFLGTAASGTGGLTQAPLANPNRTWEKATKLNIGFDASFDNDKLTLSVDYYNNHQYDLLLQRGASTGLLGQDYPLENIGVNRYRGIELTAGWNDHIGQLRYYASVNFSTQSSKVIDNDEPQQPYSYLSSIGSPIGQLRGYVAQGLYDGTATVPSIPGYQLHAGDIYYKDLNNDGVINQLDITTIGNKKPLMFYGINIGFSYQGFDLSFVVQGLANNDINLAALNQFEFQNNGVGQAYTQQLGRYTPGTAATASYPRLSVGNNINNDRTSSYWIRSGSYVRLKNAEVGYTFRQGILTKAKISAVRIFVQGQNLFTVTQYKQGDPEVPYGMYPLLRVINGGINVKF